MMREFSFPTAHAMICAAAAAFGGAVRHAAAMRGVVHAAFSGGRTPVDLFRLLARDTSIPWEAVRFYQVDERCDPAESNFAVLRKELLDVLSIPRKHTYPMRDATEYEALLPEKLDIVLLGMGLDGHIASLFPGSPALAESARRVLRVPAPATALPAVERITLTLPAIRSAREVFLLFSGHAKCAVYRDRSELPVGLLPDCQVYFSEED